MAPLTLSWEAINCVVTVRGYQRQILTQVTGIAGIPNANGAGPSWAPGISALLGPSGAGKTTLLDILSGRKMAGVTGRVCLGGVPVLPQVIQKMAGYVAQNDILPATSTVQEYLQFHARLRLPAGTSPAEQHARVAALAHRMGLDKTLHTFIGDALVRGISGGEKRRVSVAVELLTQPRLLFLDEPTTGLDATNAKRLVELLAELAAGGVTVVLSIHQPRPDIFRLLDRITLLSEAGLVVYSGAQATARQHFQAAGYQAPLSINMAEYLLDLVIKSDSQVVHDLCRVFPTSDAARQQAALLQRAAESGEGLALQQKYRKYEASFRTQMHALAERLTRNLQRHPLLVGVNLLAALFMALGIGLIYFKTGRDTPGIQDRMGSLFFLQLYLALISLSSLPIWRDDRLIFVRERAAGAYGTAAYFCSMLLFDLLPMRILPPVLFAAISYPMIGLRPGVGHGLTFLLLLTLTNVAATALSMAVGAAAQSVAVANMLGCIMLLLNNFLGGFLISRIHMPGLVAWAPYFSYARYGFEGLLINEFHGAAGFRFTAWQAPGIPPEFVSGVDVVGDDVLTTFGYRLDALVRDTFLLLVFAAFYLALTFLLLKRLRPV